MVLDFFATTLCDENNYLYPQAFIRNKIIFLNDFAG